MTKKSKKRRLSRRVQKLNLSEISDGATKVTIYKGKQKEKHETATRNKEDKDSSSLPFAFEEPEWFTEIISTLSEHMGIIPQRSVY